MKTLTLTLTAIAAMALSANVYAAKPTAEAAGQIIDVDAKYTTMFNPVSVYLDAGEYKLVPVSPEEGGKFTARNAWNGVAVQCDDAGSNCKKGWQHAITFTSDGASLIPTGISKAYGEIGFCRYPIPADSTDGRATVFATAQQALDNARLMSELYPCTFTLEQGGYVYFADGDSLYIDNKGGVSYKLTAVGTDRPGKRIGQTYEHANNGWGNGDQVAPGNSALHNHAENYVEIEDFGDANGEPIEHGSN